MYVTRACSTMAVGNESIHGGQKTLSRVKGAEHKAVLAP